MSNLHCAARGGEECMAYGACGESGRCVRETVQSRRTYDRLLEPTADVSQERMWWEYWAEQNARQNPAMPKPNEPKRPPGRPEVQPEDRLQVVSIRLTDAQKAKLDRLGGSAWVREKIDRAKEKK